MVLAPRVNRVLRVVSLTFAAVAALCLLFVWAELLHRWTLFRSYGSEPYVNHVGAEYFTDIPRFSSVGLISSVVAFLAACLSRRFILGLLCCALAASALYAPRVLRSFHERRILVTYEEYLER